MMITTQASFYYKAGSRYYKAGSSKRSEYVTGRQVERTGMGIAHLLMHVE